MATIGLGFTLSANAAKMAGGVNEAVKSLDKVGKAAKETARDVSTLKTIEIGKLLAGGLNSAAQMFANAARSALSYAQGVAAAVDATNDLAERIGVSVESLQALKMAAKLSGVDDITGALQKMTIAIGQAGESGKTEAFTRLGIDFQALQAMAPEDQFKAIQQAIAALPTEAERAAAAVAIFGRSGVELLPLMNKNLQEIEDRMRRLGAIVGEDQAAAIGEMNDAFDMVAATVQGIFGQVVGNLAPAVTAIAEEFLSFVESFNSVNGEGGNGIADTITFALLDIADVFADVFDSAVAYFSSFNISMQDVGNTFTTVGNVFTAVAELLRAAFNGFEIYGNYLSLQLATFIEGFGAIFSSSAQQFGRDMRQNAQAAMAQNSREAIDALANAGTAGTNALLGESGTAANNVAGPANRAVAKARAGMTPEAREERRQQREAEKAAAEGRRAAAAAQAKDEADAAKMDAARKKRAEEIEKVQERVDKASEFKLENEQVLGKKSQQALQGNDIRSSEGIAQFMALLTGREDPALEENRKANAKLAEVVRELRALQAAPVEILGAAA